MTEQSVEHHHLDVGTEVSAKYRGAFCEARIKSLKKHLIFSVRSTNRKEPKLHQLTEDCIKGTQKVGATVEARFPEQTAWTEATITAIKDKSTYTVEFDDGDIRSLPRNFLCLQGVRHYPESDTLDHLPLTDPENFGTPVLNNKRKAKINKRLKSIPFDMDSDDSKSLTASPKRKGVASSKNQEEQQPEDEEEQPEVSKEECRKKWLNDKLLGKLVYAADGRKK